MIPSGQYRIKNLFQVDRYAAMSGENDSEVAGHDVGDVVEITVVEEVAGLVTLLDITTSKYIWIDDQTDKVVGRTEEPQVLQLSTEDGENYVIHKQDNIFVWVLNGDGNWTPIVTAPAPPPNVVDYKKKYWQFEAVESNFTMLLSDEERAPLVGGS